MALRLSEILERDALHLSITNRRQLYEPVDDSEVLFAEDVARLLRE